MMIRFNTIVQCALIVGFSYLIPVHSSFAQGEVKKTSCIAEAKKFCPNMQWGKGLGKCLMGHITELSEDCANKMTAAKEAAMEFQVACGNDVRQYCPNIKPGRGHIIQCLKANEFHLRPECKTEIQGLTLPYGDAINQNFGTS